LGPVAPTDEWRQCQGEFTTASDTKKVALFVQAYGNAQDTPVGATIWVDDVSLGPAPPAALGRFVQSRVNMSQAGEPFRFRSPADGVLDYILVCLWDRTEQTPTGLWTPMDVYREAVEGVSRKKDASMGTDKRLTRRDALAASTAAGVRLTPAKRPVPANAAEGQRSAPPAPWKAGLAKVAITPQKSLWMAGFGARKKPSEGVLQELYAKALALQDQSGQRGVLLTSDFVGFPAEVAKSIAEQVQAKYGLPRDGLILNRWFAWAAKWSWITCCG
jgi:hypothetical protein